MTLYGRISHTGAPRYVSDRWILRMLISPRNNVILHFTLYSPQSTIHTFWTPDFSHPEKKYEVYWVRILVQVTIYRRLRIGRDGRLGSLRYTLIYRKLCNFARIRTLYRQSDYLPIKHGTLVYCSFSAVDSRPTVNQRWTNVSWFAGWQTYNSKSGVSWWCGMINMLEINDRNKWNWMGSITKLFVT